MAGIHLQRSFCRCAILFALIGTGRSAMTRSQVEISRAILYIAAIVGLVYGLLFLLAPLMQFQLSQDPGVPANPGWVRWSGGVLVGIAVAAWIAAPQPGRQRALVVGLAVGYALVTIALLYSIFSGEYRGAQWFVWVPIVINGALAAAMIWVAGKQT